VKSRIILTAIWLLAFAFGVGIIESYLHIRDEQGIRILLAEDRIACMRPLLVLYGAYISGILAFWYLRPFRPSPSDKVERVRFRLAIACTLAFNAPILYLVAQWHVTGGTTQGVLADVRTAVTWAALASFLVGPVNLYYFGMKPRS